MGRPKGSKNKASVAWKELTRSICEDPATQEKLREACLNDPHLLVKVGEHAFGKPKQTVEADIKQGWMLPAGDDVAED